MKQGLVLVDPSTAEVPFTNTGQNALMCNIKIAQVPQRMGLEDFRNLPTFTAFRRDQRLQLDARSPNLREDLLGLLEVPPPGWETGNPSIIALAYYPLRVVAPEWMLYGLIMNRFVKHYESSFNAAKARAGDFEQIVMLDLHRWRRRSKESIHKLRTTRAFVEHWQATEQEPEAWDHLVKDLQHLETLIGDHARSLEALNPIITALVQLQDMRRSVLQAEDVRRLTYIALIFIPLSYVASLFSMAEQYGPGGGGFWVYWASSLPIALVVVGLSFAAGKCRDLVALGLGRFMGSR